MKKLIVNAITTTEEEFIASLTEQINEPEAGSLRAGDRMLVDSDGLAFIYILENESEFYYVSFPESTWPKLNDLLKKKGKLLLTLHEKIQVELTSIYEEFTFLLENIEGNSNYGENMENAVRQVFGQPS